MPDMESYLLDGVMPGHILRPHLPERIEIDLEIAALDAGDQLIAEERGKDRMFDAMCADGSQLWRWEDGFTVDQLRPGMYITVPGAHGREPVEGFVAEIGVDRFYETRRVIRISRYRHSERWGWKDVAVTEWERAGRLLVPLPVDLATLGVHAAPTVHVAGVPIRATATHKTEMTA